MAMFDLSLDKLREYRPEVAAPADLVDFWRRSIEKARTDDLSATFTPIDNKLAVVDTYDVTYAGFGGAPIKGWLHVPAGTTGPLPTVVQYFGYSGGRGFPHTTNLWAQAGYAHFLMDTRGQGYSSGNPGGTPDDSAYAGLNHSPGFMTAGITDPETYYYRRVYIDAVRALEAARTSPFVDPDKIIVTGGSQGGGISIAAAGLAGLAGIDLLGCAPDVPFLCHFERALQITDKDPYGEITRYLKGFRNEVETAYRTLSYFDGVNLGRLADGADAVLGRPDGRGLPAVDGLRGVQRLRHRVGHHRPEGHQGVLAQRARGRPDLPAGRAARLVREHLLVRSSMDR